MRLSVASGSKSETEATWVDIVFDNVDRWRLVLVPKNENRQWLTSSSSDRSRTTLLEWPGKLPVSFSAIRSSLISRLYRCSALGFSEEIQALRILEGIVELSYLQYPKKLARALVHSLPASPASALCRRAVRTWCKMRGNGNDGGNYNRGGGQRDGDLAPGVNHVNVPWFPPPPPLKSSKPWDAKWNSRSPAYT